MNRIRELREKKKMKQSDLGRLLNVKDAAISKYETGKVPLTADTIIKLSEIFHVSTDYLLGKDKPTHDESRASSTLENETQLSKNFFFFFFDCWADCLSRIRNCLQELDILETDFCEELDINLDKEITISELKSIAARLNVSTDFLLGISDSHFAQSLSPREKELLDLFRKLNKHNRNIVFGEIEKVLRDQPREESVAADKPLKRTGTDNSGK